MVLYNSLFSGGPSPKVLQEVSLPIITNDKCKDLIFDLGPSFISIIKDTNYTVPNTMICAGGQGGKSSCNVSNS